MSDINKKKEQSGNKFWNFVEFMCRLVFLKLLHITVLEKNWEGFMQFVKFGVIGVSNTLLAYVLNIGTLFLLKPFHLSWDYFAGNIVGFLLSVLWSFYWNNKYVFTQEDGQKRNPWKALLKTYISYGFTGIILNNMLSWVWIEKLGISKLIAPMINLLLSVPLNFIINKFWAFRTEND